MHNVSSRACGSSLNFGDFHDLGGTCSLLTPRRAKISCGRHGMPDSIIDDWQLSVSPSKERKKERDTHKEAHTKKER